MFTNPLFKALVSAIGGAVIPVIGSAMDHPSGGMLTALQHNSGYSMTFTTVALLIHNFISKAQFVESPTK